MASPLRLRGFTLIELLVVIAIIGLLSSIVLASLNSARNKGSDAAVKSNLANARAQAELFYDANNSKYSVVLGDTTTNVCNAAASAGGVKGIYDFMNSAATNASAAVQPAYNQGGGVGKVTCHACPPGIVAGACGGIHSNQWAAEAPLRAGGFWCVDSKGFNGATAASTLASGDATCN